MAAQSKWESFPEYVDRMNTSAPLEALRRGLGAIGESIDAKRQAIAYAVFDALSNLTDDLLEKIAGREPDPMIEVSEIITAKVEKLLPKLQKERYISMMDMVTIGLTEDHQIKAELEKHGIDVNKAEDLEYALKVFKDARKFYEEHVVERRSEDLPAPLRKMRDVSDIYRIFKTASGNLQDRLTKPNIKQACAILRIAAVIDYTNKDPQLAILDEAHEALRELIDKYFVEKRNSKKEKTVKFKSRRSGDISPRIHRIFDRTKKLPSIIAKLLRKPEANARTIMDGLGVTILTGSKRDSLLMVYKLFFDPDTSIFPSMNVRVGEGKNLLVTRDALEEALSSQESAEYLVDQISTDLEIEEEEEAFINDNPGSSEAYKDLIHIVVEMPLTLANGERRMVPVEFQIKDVVSSANIDANAPHTVYKKHQKKTLRQRILSNNLFSSYRVQRRSKK
ncbi:hypothetical protein HN709_04970 [Candidatus Peregrinibacteria bacterium]|jgi:uncharacterized protein (TIGR04562 family)|nr:hypothetical protein [Candidatus Peregrinibacteria bacterium]MBT7737014.1 hypothetical protein [Candidatus Peregrinibacteria bacterium]